MPINKINDLSTKQRISTKNKNPIYLQTPISSHILFLIQYSILPAHVPLLVFWGFLFVCSIFLSPSVYFEKAD